MSEIFNRIEKNYRKLNPWSERNRFEAYRLYDRDIPEYPFIIDLYKNYAVVYDRQHKILDAGKNHLEPTLGAIKKLLGASLQELVLKRRLVHDGIQQYEKISNQVQEFPVREGQFQFLVNLWDYLDTGLFLDHRPSRYKVFKNSKNKTVLNLFSYTGSLSVAAALGGGRVTSVDMSKTYLDWSKRNFELNNLNLAAHEFVQADVMQFLQVDLKPSQFDLIILDPPTFSNSKRMTDVLDTQRDHAEMIRNCMLALKHNGILYFSTNKRKFRIESELKNEFSIRETTSETIPQDFHDKQIHTSFEIRKN